MTNPERAYTLDLSDGFELRNILKPDVDTFLISRELSELVLSDPRCIGNTTTDFGTVPIDKHTSTPMFSKAFPAMSFDLLNLTVVDDGTDKTIELHLHDAYNPGRAVTLSQQKPGPNRMFRDFMVRDAAAEQYSNSRYQPQSPTGLIMSRDVVDWLEVQLYGRDTVPTQRSGIEALVELAVAGRDANLVTKEALLVLSDTEFGSCTFSCIRQEVLEFNGLEPQIRLQKYTTALTATFADGYIPAATGAKARIMTEFNGQDLLTNTNEITYDIEASDHSDQVQLGHVSWVYEPIVRERMQKALASARKILG